MQNTIEYSDTMHTPASVLSLGGKFILYYLVNMETVGFSMGPYIEGNNHVDCNSFIQWDVH